MNGRNGSSRRRIRPGDPSWPSASEWARLKQAVGGRLLEVKSPLAVCAGAPDSEACRDVLKALRNPFFVGDQPGATESTGWVDAWMFAPSVYAVAAKSVEDVVAAVNFARMMILCRKAALAQPQGAISVGAGAIWLHVYDAVTTKAGGYDQRGGCTTVGVAGWGLKGGGGGSLGVVTRLTLKTHDLPDWAGGCSFR